jgi:hypothetical protein
MDEAEIKRIIEQQGKSMSDVMSKLIKDLKRSGLSESEIKRLNQALKDETKTLGLQKNALTKANTAIDEFTNQQLKLAKASQSVNEKLYQLASSTGLSVVQSQKFADRAEAAGDVLGKLGKAAATGSGKIDDFTSAFKGRLGGIGDGISTVGTSLQSNVDTYRTLSSVGASFGQNLVELRETARSAGLPLADFTKLIENNSQNLAALYGSTTQGAKQFSKLSEQFRATSNDYLAPLGYTVNDLNETLLTNLTLQRRTGTFVEGADQQQIASATALAVELDKLSKLTGQQRGALLKQMEAQMNNEKFLAFLSGQTDEARQRLQGFTAAVGGLAPGLAEGFQDLIANAGVPVTQASKMLIMNIPEASKIIQELTAGTINSQQAMLQLKDAADRSNKSLKGVAQTGQVEFARLYGEVNKLATAKLDENAVTEEAVKRQNALTNSLNQFQDASKRLSASFQSLETGFYAFFGDIVGKGTSGINDSIKYLGRTVDGMSNTSKALVYTGTALSKFVLDKAMQAAVVFAGTYQALKAAGVGGPGGGLGTSLAGGGVGGAGGGKLGKLKTNAISGFKIGAPMVVGGILTDSLASAAGKDTETGKALDVLGSTLTGAGTGAMLGSIFGPLGTTIGGVAGGLLGGGMAAYNNRSRASGTFGETGLPFETKTSSLKVHAGERVLNPQETAAYNAAGDNTGMGDLASSMSQYHITAKEMLEQQKSTNELLNKQVALAIAMEKNTKKTSKMVDKVGPSLV